MADSKSKSTDDTKFKKVVQHFLKTPPKQKKKERRDDRSTKAKRPPKSGS